MADRKLASWLDAWYEYTEKLPSPPVFRKWAGISILASAMERKVWVKTFSVLYPNLYIFFVAPPGIGKTLLTGEARELLEELPEHHIAPASITSAALIDSLNDASRTLIMPDRNPSMVHFNSLSIVSNELGSMIHGYDNEFMNIMTDLYDNRPFSQRRRTMKNRIEMDAPQINLLTATQPSYLNDNIPIGAWDQGFMARVILIYSGDLIRRPLFSELSLNDALRKDLIHDLKAISTNYGGMKFTSEAAEAISEWYSQHGPPTPEHPRLVHYNTRRHVHLLKLCMVASISTSDELKVTIDHYQDALGWLLEAEKFMPDIFKAMKSGGDSNIIDETWHFVYQIYMKEDAPVKETRIINFLQERTPAHNIARVLEVMVRGGLLQEQVGPKTGKIYIPRKKGSY